MTGTSDGLDEIEQRFKRRQRVVPPPKRPRTEDEHAEPPEAPPEQAETTADTLPPEAFRPSSVPEMQRQRASLDQRHVQVGPGEPIANLAVRVRRSLDNHLADIVAQLRREGIRSSKSELIEMLLWELPLEADGELRNRLRAFRAAAPREEPL